MSVVTDTTNHENVLAQKKGNHKGCPYDGFAGAYFHTIDSSGGYGICE